MKWKGLKCHNIKFSIDKHKHELPLLAKKVIGTENILAILSYCAIDKKWQWNIRKKGI
jgi:hypothetical protein